MKGLDGASLADGFIFLSSLSFFHSFLFIHLSIDPLNLLSVHVCIQTCIDTSVGGEWGSQFSISPSDSVCRI